MRVSPRKIHLIFAAAALLALARAGDHGVPLLAAVHETGTLHVPGTYATPASVLPETGALHAPDDTEAPRSPPHHHHPHPENRPANSQIEWANGLLHDSGLMKVLHVLGNAMSVKYQNTSLALGGVHYLCSSPAAQHPEQPLSWFYAATLEGRFYANPAAVPREQESQKGMGMLNKYRDSVQVWRLEKPTFDAAQTTCGGATTQEECGQICLCTWVETNDKCVSRVLSHTHDAAGVEYRGRILVLGQPATDAVRRGLYSKLRLEIELPAPLEGKMIVNKYAWENAKEIWETDHRNVERNIHSCPEPDRRAAVKTQSSPGGDARPRPVADKGRFAPCTSCFSAMLSAPPRKSRTTPRPRQPAPEPPKKIAEPQNLKSALEGLTKRHPDHSVFFYGICGGANTAEILRLLYLAEEERARAIALQERALALQERALAVQEVDELLSTDSPPLHLSTVDEKPYADLLSVNGLRWTKNPEVYEQLVSSKRLRVVKLFGAVAPKTRGRSGRAGEPVQEAQEVRPEDIDPLSSRTLCDFAPFFPHGFWLTVDTKTGRLGSMARQKFLDCPEAQNGLVPCRSCSSSCCCCMPSCCFGHSSESCGEVYKKMMMSHLAKDVSNGLRSALEKKEKWDMVRTGRGTQANNRAQTPRPQTQTLRLRGWKRRSQSPTGGNGDISIEPTHDGWERRSRDREPTHDGWRGRRRSSSVPVTNGFDYRSDPRRL